jgi:hypothetical protein
MAPGPLSSASRGGFGYSFSRSQVYGPRDTSFTCTGVVASRHASSTPTAALAISARGTGSPSAATAAAATASRSATTSSRA